jgi:hypothetical protein
MKKFIEQSPLSDRNAARRLVELGLKAKGK